MLKGKLTVLNACIRKKEHQWLLYMPWEARKKREARKNEQIKPNIREEIKE